MIQNTVWGSGVENIEWISFLIAGRQPHIISALVLLSSATW